MRSAGVGGWGHRTGRPRDSTREEKSSVTPWQFYAFLATVFFLIAVGGWLRQPSLGGAEKICISCPRVLQGLMTHTDNLH